MGEQIFHTPIFEAKMTPGIELFRAVSPGLFANAMLHISVITSRTELETKAPIVASQSFRVLFNPDLTEELLSELALFDDPLEIRKSIQSNAALNLFHLFLDVIPTPGITIIKYQEDMYRVRAQLRRLAEVLNKDEEQVTKTYAAILEVCFKMPSTARNLAWGNPRIEFQVSFALTELLNLAAHAYSTKDGFVSIASAEVV